MEEVVLAEIRFEIIVLTCIFTAPIEHHLEQLLFKVLPLIFFQFSFFLPQNSPEVRSISPLEDNQQDRSSVLDEELLVQLPFLDFLFGYQSHLICWQLTQCLDRLVHQLQAKLRFPRVIYSEGSIVDDFENFYMFEEHILDIFILLQS